MQARSKHVLIILILVACVVCDQATKVIAARYLAGAAPIRLLGDTIRLHYVENPGAFLGLGAGLSPEARVWVFSIGVGLVLVLLLILLVRESGLTRVEVIAFSLVIGGGIGNLIDRVSFGIVRDFMNVGIGRVRTGVFNVADMAITAGAVLLVVHLFGRRTGRLPRDEAGQGSAR